MKAQLAEETIDLFLQSGTHTIGSREEENVIALLRKLPPGVNEQKVLDALVRMGPLKLYRYCVSLPEAYIPVLREAMRSFLRDPYASKMMLECMAYALEQDFSQPQAYKDFTDTGKFLQYIDKLQFPVEKADQFPKSDPLITEAVGRGVARALTTIRYSSRDIRAFNSFMYALGKSDLPAVAEAVSFQLQGNSLYEMNVVINALKPHKDLPNTAKGYQLVHDKLYGIQAESLAFQFAKAIGLEPALDLKWSILVQVSSDPTEKTPRKGWFVTTEVSNMWADCIQLVVTGPKGSQKGNERHGVLLGKGLGFRRIDLFALRSEMEEIGNIYGIDKLYWENADISVKGFDKSAVKTIRNWLNG